MVAKGTRLPQRAPISKGRRGQLLPLPQWLRRSWILSNSRLIVFASGYINNVSYIEQKRNSTELSKHIWNLKDNNLSYAIKWEILCRAPHYSKVTKRCNLCIAEKFHILCKLGNATLNKRNELISRCRHEDKFLLRYVKWEIQIN